MKIYYQYNPPTSKQETIVFIHGWLLNWTCFKPMIEYFKKQGFGILYLDLRGHGQSFKPRKVEDYSMHKMQTDIFSIVKKLQLKDLILVGYSLGGLVASHFATKHPKIVNKCIIISFSNKQDLFGKENPALILSDIISHIAKKQPTRNSFDFTKIKRWKEYNIILKQLHLNPLHSTFGTLENILSDNFKPKIECPCLLIGTKQDDYFDKKSFENYSRQIDAKLVLLEGTHFALLKKPSIFTKKIENFIKTL